MSAMDSVEVPVYSLGQPSRRTGLGGFSMKTTVIGGVGFITFLLLQLLGAGKIGLIVLGVTALIAVVISVPIGGRSLAQMIEMIIQDWRSRYKKEHIYLSGPSSRIANGHYRLPGVLARTEMHAAIDAAGRPFCAIFDRPRREATVLLNVQLSGQTAITQEERNMQTAEWGRWLASLSLSGDIISMAMVVASRPGTGDVVAQEVAANVKDSAPEIARRIMNEAAATLSQGAPEIDAHIALTFSVSVSGADDVSFLDLIGMRLPTLYESLSWSGIQAAPMRESDVCARAHMFFHPSAEKEFEELSVHGVDHGLSWEDVGPAWCQKDTTVYHHDGAKSMTWEMAQAPRSTFEDTLLSPLIGHHGRIARKRVALVYRPFEAGQGAGRVEAEHQDAMVAANSSKKIRSAAAEMRLEHTDAARRAQARGAQLGRYSMFVTVTVNEDEDLGSIKHDVQQLGAQSNLRLRVMKRQQDAAFAVSCGLGQIPWSKPSTSTLAGM